VSRPLVPPPFGVSCCWVVRPPVLSAPPPAWGDGWSSRAAPAVHQEQPCCSSRPLVRPPVSPPPTRPRVVSLATTDSSGEACWLWWTWWSSLVATDERAVGGWNCRVSLNRRKLFNICIS
jgi:hypothetical protein